MAISRGKQLKPALSRKAGLRQGKEGGQKMATTTAPGRVSSPGAPRRIPRRLLIGGAAVIAVALLLILGIVFLTTRPMTREAKIQRADQLIEKGWGPGASPAKTDKLTKQADQLYGEACANKPSDACRAAGLAPIAQSAIVPKFTPGTYTTPDYNNPDLGNATASFYLLSAQGDMKGAMRFANNPEDPILLKYAKYVAGNPSLKATILQSGVSIRTSQIVDYQTSNFVRGEIIPGQTYQVVDVSASEGVAPCATWNGKNWKLIPCPDWRLELIPSP